MMLAPKTTSGREPVAVLGAGDLVSHLHRGDNADDPANYRFNMFRLSQGLQATHELGPRDLRDVVKLCQVLAFAIVDDGWVPTQTSNSLRELFDELDTITRRWSNTDDG
jgi:hypothetical protein